MTDREMLELAAKAAGIYYWIDGDAIITHGEAPVSSIEWNPLHDDGDALRLAVMLDISLNLCSPAKSVMTSDGFNGVLREEGSGIQSVRRAVVRAAAEIGKAMP